MKKLLSLILIITLTLTLFASCGKTEEALTAAELLDLGEKYLLDMDYEQAIVYFNKVIEVEPKNKSAYLGLAEAYVGAGDTDSAVEALQTALEAFSDDSEARIAFLEKLIEIDPTNEEWYIELAQIYVDNGDTDKAIEILQSGAISVSDATKIIEMFYSIFEINTSSSNIQYFDDGSWVEYEYGSYGMLKKATYYKADGTLWQISEFDSNGREEKNTNYYYYTDNGFWTETLFEYDENGNKIKEIYYYYDENDLTSWSEASFNSSGKVIESIGYDSDGVISGWSEYEYDEEGNRIKDITRRSDGSIYDVTEFESNGRWIKSTTYNSDGSVMMWSEFEYEDGVYSHWKRSIVYGSYGYTIYEYDSNFNETKNTVYDKYGNIEGWNEYEYDEDGNRIKWLCYDSNGNVVNSWVKEE
ncbi:MAG: tetratricopeptide repeat protein [Oscillospiraceae bacterium]|nr:tetratricopeptide repeat protein [Oscillospiraceae bacterium]